MAATAANLASVAVVGAARMYGWFKGDAVGAAFGSDQDEADASWMDVALTLV